MRRKVRTAYFLIFTGYIFMWLFLFSVSYTKNVFVEILCGLFSAISVGFGLAKLNKQKQLWKKSVFRIIAIDNCKKTLKDHWQFVIVLLILSILYFVQSYHVHPRWDNNLYYKIIASNGVNSLFDIQTISVATYLRTAFCLPIFALKCMTGDGLVAMMLAAYIVYMIAGVYFYRIVALLYPSINKKTRIMISLIFLVNPFVFGMSTSVNWDYFSMCLILPVYYHYIKKEYTRHLLWTSIFLFTKEVNILVYFGMVLGFLWVDFKNGEKLKDILLGYRYYGMLFLMGQTALVALSGLMIAKENVWVIYIISLTYWAICYLLLEVFHKERVCSFLENNTKQFKVLFVVLLLVIGIVGSYYAGNYFPNGSFGWDFSFVIEKLKVLYLMNFNWLLSSLAFVGIVTTWKKKRWPYIIPLLCGDVIFVSFSILFQTYNHPRYIDIHLTCLCLFSIFAVKNIVTTKITNLICGVIIVCMMGQNYKSFDPVTNAIFPHIKYGEGDIITTSYVEPISDSAVYNVEWTYFDKALNLALEDAVLSGGDNLFPTLEILF